LCIVVYLHYHHRWKAPVAAIAFNLDYKIYRLASCVRVFCTLDVTQTKGSFVALLKLGNKMTAITEATPTAPATTNRLFGSNKVSTMAQQKNYAQKRQYGERIYYAPLVRR
jgi:hypothetical protein